MRRGAEGCVCKGCKRYGGRRVCETCILACLVASSKKEANVYCSLALIVSDWMKYIVWVLFDALWPLLQTWLLSLAFGSLLVDAIATAVRIRTAEDEGNIPTSRAVSSSTKEHGSSPESRSPETGQPSRMPS